DHMPLNIAMLDSTFKKELSRRSVTEASTYIEYIDLKNDNVLQHSKPNNSSGKYSAPELVIIDIFNTLGIKGYIKISPTANTKTSSVKLLVLGLLIVNYKFYRGVNILTLY